MASSNPQQASGPPPKPWERAGGSSGGAPFKPPSAGSTSDVVEASGTARPGEVVSTADRGATVNTNSLGRPVPSRPWEQNYGSSTYGGYGSTTGLGYNSGYGTATGTGMYGGGLGGASYGGGMYGNSMYRGGGYGGSSLYGSSSGMYGGGMYGGGGGYGGQMGGYGMGGMGMGGMGMGGMGMGGMGMGGMGMGGPPDPNDPYGGPSSPPGFWMSFMRVMQGVVTFFGRVSILIDQNTQAFHMFMQALLQLFDRSGMLYGELARFVLRVLGIKSKPRKLNQVGPDGLPLPGPGGPHHQGFIEGPKPAGAPHHPPSGNWDNVWGN